MSKLKPCPWCGEIPTVETLRYADPQRPDKYYVVCRNGDCPCEPSTYAHTSKGVVVRAWNKRIPEPSETEKVNEVK